MKTCLLISFVIFFLTSLSFGQPISIANVQDTTGGPGDGVPHLIGSVVTVQGIVSAESWAFGGGWYCIQDDLTPWSGIYIWEDTNRPNAYGDRVEITGTVEEWYGLTYIYASDYVRLDSGRTVEPVIVTTGEIATDGVNAEAYEGVLVRVKHATITNPDLDHGEWEIDDGSGPCRVDDEADYYFRQAEYDSVRSLTGVLNYSFDDTKIEPRLAWDVVEASEFTRIQRIQQVRYSALLKTNADHQYDISPAAHPLYPNDWNYQGETVRVKGVVTLPTGLSDPGYGIEFQVQDPEGGPWSSLLSWAEDTTQYPRLFIGDMVEFDGYIWEWQSGGSSNETELMVTSSNIEIPSWGNPIPMDTIETGVLRNPTTAEQWENCRVVVKDAVVTDLDPSPYELFSVDDGSGVARVGQVSTAIPDASEYTDPPLGTVYQYIYGYASHRYGSYEDSSTYKLEPLYEGDMVVGSGPPMIDNEMRVPGTPNSSDDVVVTVDVTTNLEIQSVVLNYSVNSGIFQTVDMTAGEEDSYSGTIPAQSDGAFIEYYFKATDTAVQSTLFPSDTASYKFGYVSKDSNHTIADIQYSPWPVANSPFAGYTVEVTGIVTVDTAVNNLIGTYCIQDAEVPWSGVFVYGIDEDLDRGDEITVSGIVTEHVANHDQNADSYRWDYNTAIIASSFEVISTGNNINPIEVLTKDLNADSSNAESYEGVHVKITDAELSAINSYDVTFNDGSGECLVDGDFLLEEDHTANDHFYLNDGWPDYADPYLMAFGDTLRPPNDGAELIQGIFTWSWGSFKIEIRDDNDFDVITGIGQDELSIPLTYKLSQNFPNPFNPETKISFKIPEAHDLTIDVYNMLGQKVRTLVDKNFKAGQHVVNWNGRADEGFIVPTGIYIYRIKAGDFISSKKMLMLK